MGAFPNSLQIRHLNCSHNRMTMWHPGAFNYTFKLVSLDLSHNSLTFADSSALNNNPALAEFRINNNRIWAIPTTANHILDPYDAGNNVITCSTYETSCHLYCFRNSLCTAEKPFFTFQLNAWLCALSMCSLTLDSSPL